MKKTKKTNRNKYRSYRPKPATEAQELSFLQVKHFVGGRAEHDTMYCHVKAYFANLNTVTAAVRTSRFFADIKKAKAAQDLSPCHRRVAEIASLKLALVTNKH